MLYSFTIADRQAQQDSKLVGRQQQKLSQLGWENLKMWIAFVLSCVAWFTISNRSSIASPASSMERGILQVQQLPIQPQSVDTELGILRLQQLPTQIHLNGASELGRLRLQQIGDSELGRLRLQQIGDSELGRLRLRQVGNSELGRLRLRRFNRSEIGRLRLRQLELQPPKEAKLSRLSQPVLRLLGQASYFQTSNIFSGVDPRNDGIISTGLALWATPALGPKTSIVTAIDGSLIAYAHESEFNYNQLRFRAGIRQELMPGTYGEVGWVNQQLFRATAGDRFFNEHSIRLALYRRDRFTDRLRLDSFYEFRLGFADPDSRSRVINSLLVSLSYYVQNNLQVGIDYQFGLSEFTQIEREDQYHRLLGRLTYSLSRSSQVSVQGGLSLGGSSDPRINFNDFFFSISYTVELGKF